MLKPKYKKKKRGSPGGFKWHWILLLFDEMIGDKYDFSIDHSSHNYRLIRSKEKKRFDEFIIIRTSPKCYRIMYFNNVDNKFEYKSFKKAAYVAKYVLKKVEVKNKQEAEFANEFLNDFN